MRILRVKTNVPTAGLCGEVCDALTVEHEEANPLNIQTLGKVTFDESKCDNCKICEEICPTDSIKVERSITDTKLPGEVAINKEECMYCTWCSKTCPVENTIDRTEDF